MRNEITHIRNTVWNRSHIREAHVFLLLCGLSLHGRLFVKMQRTYINRTLYSDVCANQHSKKFSGIVCEKSTYLISVRFSRGDKSRSLASTEHPGKASANEATHFTMWRPMDSITDMAAGVICDWWDVIQAWHVHCTRHRNIIKRIRIWTRRGQLTLICCFRQRPKTYKLCTFR